MVRDEVEHQRVVLGQVGHVRPGPEVRVDLPVVDDGEPVVARPREHRQQVDVTDHVADVLVENPGKGVQRCLPGATDAVAVRDQAHRPVGRPVGPAPAEPRGVGLRERHELPAHLLVRVRVERREQGRDPVLEPSRAHGAPTPAWPATSPAATRAPCSTTSSPNGSGGGASESNRRVVWRAHASSSAMRSEHERRPPNRASASRALLAQPVRRAGHEAVRVVDPPSPVLPGAGGERHEPAQPARPVLAALVEGVRRDAHGVHEADARQDRCPASEEVDVGADGVPDQREPAAVGLHLGDVVVTPAGDRTAVEEVELEVADAEAAQPGQLLRQVLPDAGMGEVEADQVLTPVVPGVADEPVGVLTREGAVGADEEGREPQARCATGGPDLIDQAGERGEAVTRRETTHRARGSSRRRSARRRRRGRSHRAPRGSPGRRRR